MNKNQILIIIEFLCTQNVILKFYITQCTGLTMQLRVICVSSFKLINYWMVKLVSIRTFSNQQNANKICDGCCHFWSLGGHLRFLLFDVDG